MTTLYQPRSADPAMREVTYNLFRNTERPELFCAVPDDHPVPHFIVAEGWAFQSALRPHEAALMGFYHRAACAGVRYNGFYLFHGIA